MTSSSKRQYNPLKRGLEGDAFKGCYTSDAVAGDIDSFTVTHFDFFNVFLEPRGRKKKSCVHVSNCLSELRTVTLNGKLTKWFHVF